MARGRLRKTAAALALVGAVAGGLVAAATPALAALAPNTIRFWGPNVSYSGDAGTAKRTTVMLKVGNVLYIGGNFDTIQPEPPNGATAVPTISQPYLYAVDATTGAYLPQFDPALDGTVNALSYDQATNTLFVGGAFTHVDGQALVGLASMDPTTGALLGTQRPISSTAGGAAAVYVLYQYGRMLYVGGQFTNIGGSGGSGGGARGGLARLDLDNANRVTSFQTYFTGGKPLSLISDGMSLFVGGDFFSVDQSPNGANPVAGTGCLAAVDPTTGAPITTFTPNVTAWGTFQPCAPPPPSGYYDIPRGRALALVNGLLLGGFGGFGGAINVYDTTGPVTAPRFSYYADSDVQTMQFTGTRLLVGGHFTNLSLTRPRDPNGLPRCEFASFSVGTPDLPNDQLLTLLPDPDVQNGGHLGAFTVVANGDSDSYWAGLITRIQPAAPGNPLCSNGTQTSPYSYIMRVFDGGGATDTTAPSTPTNAVLTAGTSNSTVITWSGSTDDTAVTAYYVYLNGVRTYVTPGSQATFTIPNLDPGAAPPITIQALDPFGNRSVRSAAATYTPPPPAYGAMGEFFPTSTPQRIVDTRTGAGGSKVPLAGGVPRPIQVAGQGEVPATGAQLVALNVTVVGPTKGGFLTVYPDGEARPNASNLNFTPGQTVPNFVMVRVGASGKIDAYLNTGAAHLIVDVVGWVADSSVTTPGSRLATQTPQRVLDTRTGNGGPAKAFGRGEVRDVQVVPANQGYKAVAINLTGVGPSAATYITAYPAEQATAPNASNLNLLPGQTRPNLVMVGVSPEGKIKLLNAFGNVHLLVDVVGAFKGQAALDNTMTGRLVGLQTPTRVVDTRSTAPIGPKMTNTLDLSQLVLSAPAGTSLQGVVMNATATRASAATFLTVFPTGPQPNTSTLNVTPGQDVPNGAVVGLTTGQNVSVYNQSGSVDYIFDVGALLLA